MKKCLILIILIFIFYNYSYAVEKTPSPSPLVSPTASNSANIDEAKVQALKDKLASKVAELRQSQTRGFYGEIASLSKTSFTLVTPNGEIKVRYNDDTMIYKITNNKKISAEIKDLQNGYDCSVLGLYDDTAGLVSSKFILLQTLPKYLVGDITDIDKTNAVIGLKLASNKIQNLDYEKTTIANEISSDAQTIVKSGLSKLVQGDKLIIWGDINEDDMTKLMINRFVRIPKDLLNPKILESTTSSATPSSDTNK